MNDNNSKTKKLNTGLTQDSVLAPLLFNLWTSDEPHTVSRKFMYSDDFQYKQFTSAMTLYNNLPTLQQQ